MGICQKILMPILFVVKICIIRISQVTSKLLLGGAGTNNIPIEEASAQGIVVFNTPGANANAVKEAVIAALLLSARDYLGANRWVNTLTGTDIPKQIEAGKKAFAGNEIAGKKIGSYRPWCYWS